MGTIDKSPPFRLARLGKWTMKTLNKTDQTSKNPNPVPRKSIGGWIADLRSEGKKISWPTPMEATRLTSTVLGVCFLVSGVLFLASWIVETLLRIIGVGL